MQAERDQMFWEGVVRRVLGRLSEEWALIDLDAGSQDSNARCLSKLLTEELAKLTQQEQGETVERVAYYADDEAGGYNVTGWNAGDGTVNEKELRSMATELLGSSERVFRLVFRVPKRPEPATLTAKVKEVPR